MFTTRSISLVSSLIIVFFILLTCKEQEQTDYSEMKTIPIIIQPESDTKFCNEMPLFEWTQVKYADQYDIFINDILIDTIDAESDLSQNMKYDVNEKELEKNFIEKICTNDNLRCPYCDIAYIFKIRAFHEFQYMPSEPTTFYILDCPN